MRRRACGPSFARLARARRTFASKSSRKPIAAAMANLLFATSNQKPPDSGIPRVSRPHRGVVLERLKGCEAELRARGVAHAALFGSIARGDDRPDSDIDIMVEIAPGARVGLFQYVGIVRYLEDL